MKKKHAGFSLLEMIVVITIISLIAGTLAPVASVIINNQRRKTTTQNLQALSEAILAFYEDTQKFPAFLANSSLEDLSSLPENATLADKWNGPYLLPVVEDDKPQSNSVTHDAFTTPYNVSFTETFTNKKGEQFPLEMVITSAGADLDITTIDDNIVKRTNVIFFLKSETREELRAINHAIELFEKSSGEAFSVNPGTSNARTAISTLQGQNLLPQGNAFLDDLSEDSWGDDYVINGGRFFSDNVQ